MNISGFTKLTLIDYPKKIACIIFTQGCNYNCAFCQNSGLIKCNKNNLIARQEIFNYLKKRKNIIEGVVISGGEPTIQPDLYGFVKDIKEMGFLVKLDTNGSNPEILKRLVDEKLIDYIAMDVKNIFDEYDPIVNLKKVNVENIKQSIEIIKNSSIDHEFRTTIMKNYHDIDKLTRICEYLGEEEKYYLQNFEDSEAVLDKSLVSFTADMLINIQGILRKNFPNVSVRGI
ncbi:MAG: anaerobic ribonucleoside-triphosphate reductase activating protein [Firmicutes bacterium]|nr:anaerobic ribonucleoside-triphosphate reductase activating protein [Bacillota bacterium]